MQVETNSQENTGVGPTSPTSPGKRKKDYVYKFWTILCKRCKPILEQYKEMQLAKSQMNSAANDTSTNNDDNTKSNDNDVVMKDSAEAQNSNDNKLTFETLGEFMRNKQLILLVGKFWAVLQAYIKKHAIEKESIKDARIILSTLMISMFPHDVLDVSDLKDMDALSEACYIAAQHVLTHVFETTPHHHVHQQDGADIDSNQTKFHCEQAFKSIDKFFNAFKDWQTQDKSKILESLLNFYEQWQRSYQVLKLANMNEGQKQESLQTIENNANNMKQKILKLLNGNENEMNKLCLQIDEKLLKEQIEKENNKKNNETTNNNNNNNNNKQQTNDENDNSKPSVEDQLRARGVPVNMKTGKNLVASNQENEEKKQDIDIDNNNNDSKYIEDVNGSKMLVLDSIIMEEASKKYWMDFEKEIENENWSRLFELLSEVLKRIKTLSPKKDHAMLDDMIDVSFIQQTIQNGLIDATGFYGIFHGIWKQLRSLHAPINDKPWDQWHDKILQDMSKSDATWAKLLSSVFNKFLIKIDEIEAQIDAINAIKEKQNTK